MTPLPVHCDLCRPCQRGDDCHPVERCARRHVVLELREAGYALGRTLQHDALTHALAGTNPWQRYALTEGFAGGALVRTWDDGRTKQACRMMVHP